MYGLIFVFAYILLFCGNLQSYFMKSNSDLPKTSDNQEFESDYEKIITYQIATFIRTEWYKKGDYFQKFSIYDTSYSPVRTSGGTTLIKAL